jgi:hypothetical protein
MIPGNRAPARSENETTMSLSNSALMDELQQTAEGDLSVLYKAISLTPDRATGFLGQKTKRAEDVKAKIRELLAEATRSAA